MSRFTKRVGAAIAVGGLAIGLTLAGATAANAAGPNYCHSTEWWNQLGYDGYVQVQASYSDSGRHAKTGWMRWYIPSYADSGRLYTPSTTSSSSTLIKSKSSSFQDSLNPWEAQTQFSCGYTWW